jgi:Mg2+ and Co2+ transporter CorA
MNLLGRFDKHYEYSLRDISIRSHGDDLIDLQRWKRRSKQSRHKLTLVYNFVVHWMQHEDDKKPWKLILYDINFMRLKLQSHIQTLEQTVALATSMVQVLDAQRSIVEAVSVRKLTYIAIIFIPLSWMSSLFGMSDDFAPGQARFWMYFASAVPFTVLLFLVSAIPFLRTKFTNFSNQI